MTNNRLLEKLSEQAWLFTNSKCQAISFLLCGNVWKHSTQGKYNYEGVRAKMRNVSVSECILKNLHVKVIVFIKWAFFAWKIFIILKWWADFTPSLLLEMCSRARSHMILSGDNKRNQTCFLCLEEKAQREKVVDSLIFRKKKKATAEKRTPKALALHIFRRNFGTKQPKLKNRPKFASHVGLLYNYLQHSNK